jgi:hypothetical protein
MTIYFQSFMVADGDSALDISLIEVTIDWIGFRMDHIEFKQVKLFNLTL